MSTRVRSTESCAGCNRSWYVDDGKGEQRQYICGSCGKCMNCEEAYARGKADGMAEAQAIVKARALEVANNPRLWNEAQTILQLIADALELKEHRK